MTGKETEVPQKKKKDDKGKKKIVKTKIEKKESDQQEPPPEVENFKLVSLGPVTCGVGKTCCCNECNSKRNPVKSTDAVSEKEGEKTLDNIQSAADCMANCNESLCNYKEDVKTAATDLISREMPKKIMELTELVNSAVFSTPAVEQTHTCASGRCGAGEHRGVNTVMVRLCDVVLKACLQQREDSQLLSTWISLLTPQMLDGHNFGVEIQETVQEYIYFMDVYDPSSYHVGRASVLADMGDFPDIEDWKEALKRYDEKHLQKMRWKLIRIRDYYVALHHVITLNMDKIMNPRPQVDSHMI